MLIESNADLQSQSDVGDGVWHAQPGHFRNSRPKPLFNGSKKSRNQGSGAVQDERNRLQDEYSLTSVSSMHSHGLGTGAAGAGRKRNVLASNYARLERLLRKTAKEDDDQIDYKKLMRRETKVERLQRQREEKAQMNQREKIERDIICTDPADYLNKLTETKKIELHMVNEAFVRSSRRNSKACSTTKNSGKRRVETTSEQ